MEECDCFWDHKCNYFCEGGRHQDLGYSKDSDLQRIENWNDPYFTPAPCLVEGSCRIQVINSKLIQEAPSEEERYGGVGGKRPFAYLLTFIRKET